MNISRHEQGSLEWMLERLGIPTASQFDRILTPKTLTPSGQQLAYRAELLAEYLLDQPLDYGSSSHMERGNRTEQEARAWYEMHTGLEVDWVGFCTTDDGLIGCSPDGLVSADGGLEIKCPMAKQHVLYMMGEPLAHIGQVQGGLRITGRKWWDVLSYHPDLPPVLQRTTLDAEWQTAFGLALAPFLKALEADKAKWADYRIPRPWHEGSAA